MNSHNILETIHGPIMLDPAPDGLLRLMRDNTPYGIAAYTQPKLSAPFGVVVQCGKRSWKCVKMQPLDRPAPRGRTRHMANTMLVAAAMRGYAGYGFSGVFIPAPYMIEKKDGQIESGIACFASPYPLGREVREHDNSAHYDEELGRGAWAMVSTFLTELQRAAATLRLPAAECIRLRVCDHREFDQLDLVVLSTSSHIVFLGEGADGADWGLTGLRTMAIKWTYHLHAKPAVIRQRLLKCTKKGITLDPDETA